MGELKAALFFSSSSLHHFNEKMMATSRPGENDRALPMAYGDLILLSCNVTNAGSAYLSEDGCVVKDSDVEMRTSSRELVFEVRAK